MRIARFSADGEVAFGVVGEARGDGGQPAGAGPGEPVVAGITGHPFGAGSAIRLTGTTHRLADVTLLAPVVPSKVILVDGGDGGRGGGPGGGPPAEPVLTLKPSTAVCGPGDLIRWPASARRLDAGGRLAVVIGRLCRRVDADRAAGVIFGYTCGTDVTARDLQERDGQWTRAKGFDTFCPLGPWIETGADPADLALTTSVNGEARQRARTSQAPRAVAALVAYASGVMTLLPGDVLLTGLPGAVPLADQDEVCVTVENIGTLTNRVARE